MTITQTRKLQQYTQDNYNNIHKTITTIQQDNHNYTHKTNTTIHTRQLQQDNKTTTTIHTRQLQQYTQDNYNNTHKAPTTIHTHSTFVYHFYYFISLLLNVKVLKGFLHRPENSLRFQGHLGT